MEKPSVARLGLRRLGRLPAGHFKTDHYLLRLLSVPADPLLGPATRPFLRVIKGGG